MVAPISVVSEVGLRECNQSFGLSDFLYTRLSSANMFVIGSGLALRFSFRDGGETRHDWVVRPGPFMLLKFPGLAAANMREPLPSNWLVTRVEVCSLQCSMSTCQRR